jgi:hypothetical protein
MNRNRIAIAVLGLVVLGVFALVFVRLPQPPAPARQAKGQAENTLASALDALHKGANYETCRGAVQQLNVHLAQNPDQKPRPLPEAARSLLTDRLGLEADELAEIQSSSFTLLDAHHLDFCLLLNHAAQSLNLEDQPPLKRATAGLAWVVRQVRLRERDDELLPVQFILRRGWGTPVERAFVFLGLLDQLGVDGCMIALPGDGPTAGAARYWIPGALIDNQVYLFDTRLGLPLPGPDGKGIATLADVRTQPDLLRALTVDEKHPYDVTPEQAKRAEVHVVCSLSALSPRMQFLQQELAATDRVSLAVKPEELLKKFQAATKGPAFEGSEVRFGSAPGDPNAPTRVLRRFLPPEEGGTDKTGRRARSLLELIPWGYLPQPIRDLPGEPGQRLQQFFADPFLSFALAPKMPRDLLLHGRFDEATKNLVAIRDDFRRTKTLLQAQTNVGPRVVEWCSQAIEAYAHLLRAQQASGKAAPGQVTLAAAQARVNELWKQGKDIEILVRAAAAAPLDAEATYLLALCKHEQAERAQAKLDRSRQDGKEASAAETKAAQDAWRAASDWWETYLENYSAAMGAAGARWMRARVFEALGQTDSAASLLRDLSGELTSLEKTGRLYAAQRLQSRAGR